MDDAGLRRLVHRGFRHQSLIARVLVNYPVMTICERLRCAPRTALVLQLYERPRPSTWRRDVQVLARHLQLDAGRLDALLSEAESKRTPLVLFDPT